MGKINNPGFVMVLWIVGVTRNTYFSLIIHYIL